MGQVSNTDFNFIHKVFEAPGAHFARANGTKEPMFYCLLGDNQASVRLPSLRETFEIPASSEDNKLLGLVEESLKFVKRINPGDSIPNEVLDGTASWKVDERHSQLVEIRLTVSLALWLTGDTSSINAKSLLELAEDQETKKRAQEAIDKLAETIGGENARQRILDRIAKLTTELSYIQALKEHFGHLRHISDQLSAVQSLFHEDKVLCQEIDRIQLIIAEPFKEYRQLIREIEAQSSDILGLVKAFEFSVRDIRRTRDKLRSSFIDWDEWAKKWADQHIGRDCGVEKLVRDTYRFVATNFPLSNGWGG